MTYSFRVVSNGRASPSKLDTGRTCQNSTQHIELLLALEFGGKSRGRSSFRRRSHSRHIAWQVMLKSTNSTRMKEKLFSKTVDGMRPRIYASRRSSALRTTARTIRALLDTTRRIRDTQPRFIHPTGHATTAWAKDLGCT